MSKQDESALPSLALVFGYIAIKELQRLEDRVAVLSRLGYGNEQIAAICDTNRQVVATLKVKVRKSNRRRQK